MRFGERLRELRKQRGLTQRDLAGVVGVDFTYISKIENGHMPPPSEETIIKLARALRVDADELLSLAKKVPPHYRKEILKKGSPLPDFFRLKYSLTRQEAQSLEDDLRKLIERWKARKRDQQ